MKKFMNIKKTGKLGWAAMLMLAAMPLMAQQGQPGGGFDPQQMRQRMLQRVHDQLEVTDESEWKLISERVTKVMDARRAASTGGGGGFGMFGGPGGPPPGAGGFGGGGPAGGPPGANDSGPGAGSGPGGPPPGAFAGGGFNRERSPEVEALQKAIESKASATELKTRMEEVKTARIKKTGDLEKARDELRQVLSARQEAIAMTMGLL